MTLDSSALVAILFEEPGYLDLVDRILAADQSRSRRRRWLRPPSSSPGAGVHPHPTSVLGLLKELGIHVVPFGDAEWPVAVEAFLRYGRGRHPASLNFGDCLAYASAAAARDALLFVGDDFAKTDITAA